MDTLRGFELAMQNKPKTRTTEEKRMGNQNLTPKQTEILEYIKSEILRRGFPPAVREICDAVHLKSTSSVHAHLETLDSATPFPWFTS